MNTNTGQPPNLYTTASGVPSGPPTYTSQQPVYGQDQKYNYEQPQQQPQQFQQPQQQFQQPQQPQQVFGGQQYYGGPPTGAPPAHMSQQPQIQQGHPGNPVMTQNFGPQVVVVQQAAPAAVVVAQQPTLMVGGLTTGPGIVDCPRCGRRGLTNATTVPGATTHVWAALCCFFLCLGCIPYLMTDLHDVEHHCSSCGAHVATWRR